MRCCSDGISVFVGHVFQRPRENITAGGEDLQCLPFPDMVPLFYRDASGGKVTGKDLPYEIGGLDIGTRAVDLTARGMLIHGKT